MRKSVPVNMEAALTFPSLLHADSWSHFLSLGWQQLFRPPNLCPHMPVASEHSTAKTDDGVWRGWAAHFSISRLCRVGGGGKAHRLLFQLPGFHSHSELAPRLPGPQAHPFLICTESCLPLKVGTHQVCSIPLMQKAGCPKFCVSVLISGWVESPQRSASSQLWSPWITPCPSVLREMNEWRVAHRGFSISISLRPSLFPPSSTHSEDALPFSDLDPTAGSLGLGTGILPPVFPSGGTGGLWSHPAPRKGWLQGLCRAGRWGYFMTQEDVTGRK